MEQGTLDFGTYNSRLEKWIESRLFRYAIIALIITNAIVLGVLTYKKAPRSRSRLNA